MASRDEPAGDGPREGNVTRRPRGGPVNQEEEEEEEEEVGYPNPELISLNNSCQGQGKAELQGIFWSFYKWLQPNMRSKQEMILRLSVEQFLLNRPRSERAAWRERWRASGRDLEAFVEHVGREGLRPPRMIRVRVQGQEALFSENMPLRQVLAHFQEPRSAAAPMALTLGTPRPAAPGDADGDTLSGADHRPRSLLILEGESPRGPAESEASGESARSSGSAGPGAPTAREESPREEAPREAGGAQQLHPCDLCPRVFRRLSWFRLHQGRHNAERPFACATCGKGFSQASDLRGHQLIHAEERPFRR